MTSPRLPTEARRTQLADAALHLLSHDGAGALTIKEIAQAVGLTDGAVFRHFPSKQALLEAAVARFEAHLTPIPRGGGDPVERLGRFFVERVEAVSQHPDVLRLAFTDRLQQIVGPEGGARLQKQMRRSVTFVRRCLKEAQANGALDPSVRPEVVAWMVTGAMRGCAASHGNPQAAWDNLRQVLFAKPPARRRRRTS